MSNAAVLLDQVAVSVDVSPDVAKPPQQLGLNTETEEPNWLRRGQIPSLNGLRAVAVMLVLLAHAHQTAGFPSFALLHWIGSQGAIGVDVFFVLSGFLITNLLLRELKHTGRISIKHFYLRRVLRIVPAYAALLVTVALLQAGGLAQVSTRDWIAGATYTMNFVSKPAWEIGHAWSLSIEEHYYLVWPLLMALSVDALGRRFAVGCMVFCFLARWVVTLVFPQYTPMMDLWTFTRLDGIAAGSLLAFLAWDPRWRQRLDWYCSRRNACLKVLLCLCLSLGMSISGKLSVGFSYTLKAVCIALLVWMAVRSRESWASRFLNYRFVAAIGVISYSLYLWQQLFLHPGQTSFVCTFPQNVVFAVLAAILSYFVIESPFLALKSRLSRGRGS